MAIEQPFEYTIKSGDSIEKISRAHGVPQKTIRELNNIEGNRIFAGKKIILPYSFTPQEQLRKFIGRSTTPEERAFLNAISEAEGTKTYGTLFGGKELSDIGKYTVEEIMNMSTSKKFPDGKDVGYGTFAGGTSGATGRYQFMGDTLKDFIKNHPLGKLLAKEKFTPAIQDQLILAEMRRKGVDPSKGVTQESVNKLSELFASFPTDTGSSKFANQPAKSYQFIEDSYKKALDVYKPEVINTSTSKWTVG